MSTHQQEHWLQTPLGKYLQAEEQALFDAAMGNIFGFNALQYGMPQVDLLRQCRMPFVLRAGAQYGAVRCLSTQLPLQTNSIDLLLLPHVLEFSVDPHQTLREAERILVPEGHLLISGFNPVSAWGLKRRLGRAREYPWCGDFFTLTRIRDWLALLDFEIDNIEMSCQILPFSNPIWLKRCQFMNKAGKGWLGGVYFITARKKILGMRLIRPDWKRSRLEQLVTAPSQRQPSQQNQQ